MKKQKLIESIQTIHTTNLAVYRALDLMFDWLTEQEQHIKTNKDTMKKLIKLSMMHGEK